LTPVLLSAFLGCHLAQAPPPIEDKVAPDDDVIPGHEVVPPENQGAYFVEGHGHALFAGALAPRIAREVGTSDIRGEGPDPLPKAHRCPDPCSITVRRFFVYPPTVSWRDVQPGECSCFIRRQAAQPSYRDTYKEIATIRML